jgi:Ca-activated chloride channel family protein
VDNPFLGRTYQMIESDLDEETLKAVALETGGQFFRAQNSESLRRIYEHIDKLEKTEIKSRTYTSYNELFSFFVFPALFLLTLEVLLANTVFRRIP